jgi:protein-S-isoprenylcysteine O-methyltransferase Ste14
MRPNPTHLALRAVAGLGWLLAVLGLLIFVGAGSRAYWQGWAYLGTFALSIALITIYLWRHDRALLARRLQAGPTAERTWTQRCIQALATIAFLGIIGLPALDHRFGWSTVPPLVALVGDILVALGLYCVYRVFRENSYAAATIEVVASQTVISSGPYALVRHPMYSGALIFLLGTPLALGSWWGLLALVPLAAVIVWRLLDEERVLAAELPGYTEYCRRVRHRLIPGVW